MRDNRRRRGSARLAAEATCHPSVAHKPQAAPEASRVTLSTGNTRRGLVQRVKGVLVRRHVRRILGSPAAAPVVAVAVVAVFAAVAVGAIIGAALVAAQRGGGFDA